MIADPHIPIDQPTVLSPLLNSTQDHTHHHHHHQQQQEKQNQDIDLDHALEKLEAFLCCLGFNQASVLSFILSWAGFIFIGVLLPVTILELSKCSGCNKYQIKDFELYIVASQACLAAVSLICLSHNLRKYGIRKFLFLDRCSGHMSGFTHLYIQQIKVSISVCPRRYISLKLRI